MLARRKRGNFRSLQQSLKVHSLHMNHLSRDEQGRTKLDQPSLLCSRSWTEVCQFGCFYLRRSTQVYKWHRKKWPFGKGGYEIEWNGKGGCIILRELRVHKRSSTQYSIKAKRSPSQILMVIYKSFLNSLCIYPTHIAINIPLARVMKI